MITPPATGFDTRKRHALAMFFLTWADRNRNWPWFVELLGYAVAQGMIDRAWRELDKMINKVRDRVPGRGLPASQLRSPPRLETAKKEEGSMTHYEALRGIEDEAVEYFLGALEAWGWSIHSRPGIWTDLCRAIERRTFYAQRCDARSHAAQRSRIRAIL